MVAIYGLVIGIALGWLRGGRLGNLRHVRLEAAWVVLPAALFQLLVITDPWKLWRSPDVAGMLLMISYAPFVFFLVRNLQVPGLTVAAIGLALNLTVMLANGGLMPVSPESQRSAGHPESRVIVVGERTTAGKGIILPAEQTRLAFLSDTIVLPPVPRPMIVSVGDLITLGGLAFGVQSAMRRRVEQPIDGGPNVVPAHLT
jgi:hypothetical protein